MSTALEPLTEYIKTTPAMICCLPLLKIYKIWGLIFCWSLMLCALTGQPVNMEDTVWCLLILALVHLVHREPNLNQEPWVPVFTVNHKAYGVNLERCLCVSDYSVLSNSWENKYMKFVWEVVKCQYSLKFPKVACSITSKLFSKSKFSSSYWTQQHCEASLLGSHRQLLREAQASVTLL